MHSVNFYTNIFLAPNAKEVFCKIKRAYDVLSDDAEKRKYDSKRATSKLLFNINNLANNLSQPTHSTYMYRPNYHQPTPPKMKKDKNWEEIRAMSRGKNLV